MRLLRLFVLALLVCVCEAKRLPHNFFRATHDSVRLENERGDAMGARRYLTMAEVDSAAGDGTLAPIQSYYTTYTVSPKLPVNRRYARPETIVFVETLSTEFYLAFRTPLVVDSAVRPADCQRRLRRVNRNAAPYMGDRASSHERGTTIDLSKRLAREQYRWLVTRLLYERALGRVLVIEERSCFHIFVGGDDV
jgi:hypothetical protein